MKPAANLSLLWQELPYLDRFEAAAKAGFEAVEVLFPYDIAVKETKRACLRHGLDLILINAPPPNYTGGPRGFAAVPELVDRFRADMVRVYRYAEALNVKFVHVMAGDGSGAAAADTFISNLVWASDAAPAGLTLTIEPLNPVAMPGYFLNDYQLAQDILEAVSAANVGLQYDSYHAQMIHGDAIKVFDQYQDRICHVQIGDGPDRTAPGTGTGIARIDFAALFSRLKSCEYRGWISGEYHPGPVTENSLDWMKML